MSSVPLGRAAGPEEIAGVAAFLASDQLGHRGSASVRRRVPSEMTITDQAARKLGVAASGLIDGPTCWIDGNWEDDDSERSWQSVDPTTAELILAVPFGSAAQAERAVLAARRAFDSGPWSSLTPRERAGLLLELADLMERHAEDLV